MQLGWSDKGRALPHFMRLVGVAVILVCLATVIIITLQRTGDHVLFVISYDRVQKPSIGRSLFSAFFQREFIKSTEV
jgi:hypothetical protein